MSTYRLATIEADSIKAYNNKLEYVLEVINQSMGEVVEVINHNTPNFTYSSTIIYKTNRIEFR